MDWRSWLNRYDQWLATLSWRQALPIATLVAAVVYLAADRWIFAQHAARSVAAQTEQAALNARLPALRQQVETLVSESGAGKPSLDTELQQEIASLEQQIGPAQELERMLTREPLAIPTLIGRAMRTPNSRVVVDSVRVRPSETITSAGDTPIYRLGIDLAVRGSYFDLVRYLQTLERDERILYSGLRLNTVRYPELTLEMSLFTLSRTPPVSARAERGTTP